MVQTPTELLAHFIVEAHYSDIPDEALAYGRSSLLDASAVGIAGSASKGAKTLNSVLLPYSTTKGAQVIGTDMRLPAPFAAMANGNTIHADDFDDTLHLIKKIRISII